MKKKPNYGQNYRVDILTLIIFSLGQLFSYKLKTFSVRL